MLYIDYSGVTEGLIVDLISDTDLPSVVGEAVSTSEQCGRVQSDQTVRAEILAVLDLCIARQHFVELL